MVCSVCLNPLLASASQVWAHYDPSGSEFIQWRDLHAFLHNLGTPFVGHSVEVEWVALVAEEVRGSIDCAEQGVPFHTLMQV